ncbi:MAG: hypothetical protein EP338_14120 [Bacteroidetes bacterium]|nr:MAG: hypothetical protein EP338_14120 [Bacteroidota bacterium]
MSHKLLLVTVSILVFFSSCLSERVQRKMELENSILNECDFIHEVVYDELGVRVSGGDYVDLCGQVSEYCTKALMEEKETSEIVEIARNTHLLRREIKRCLTRNNKSFRLQVAHFKSD